MVIGNVLAVLVQVHGRRGFGRRLLPIVEEVSVAVGRAEQHESATADVAGQRMHNRQCKANGYGRIQRVAALPHNVHAGLGGQFALARNHGMLTVCRLHGPGHGMEDTQQNESAYPVQFSGMRGEFLYDFENVKYFTPRTLRWCARRIDGPTPLGYNVDRVAMYRLS